MNLILSYIRSGIFYLGYAIGHIILGIIAKYLILTNASSEKSYQTITRFNHFVMWWLRIACNIRYEIIGAENIPTTPCIVLSNHQSSWETYLLGSLFKPQTTVVKKELLTYPFFGRAIKLLAPIALDRSRPANALKQLIQQGEGKLKDGFWVLIFPEGTRVRAGKTEKYNKGAAALANKSNTNILPIAHNAGLYWPAGQFLKQPGIIRVIIGEVISTEGKSRNELHQISENWIRENVNHIMAD